MGRPPGPNVLTWGPFRKPRLQLGQADQPLSAVLTGVFAAAQARVPGPLLIVGAAVEEASLPRCSGPVPTVQVSKLRPHCTQGPAAGWGLSPDRTLG